MQDVLWTKRSKWGKFGVLMVAIVALSSAASFLTRIAVFKPEFSPSFTVALMAPLTGPNAEIGEALRQGAQLKVDSLNTAGGIDGSLFALSVFDDQDDPAQAALIAQEIASRSDVVSVIGPLSAASAAAAADVFERAEIPMILPTHAQTYSAPRDWAFSIGYSPEDETTFLANYIRNVSGDVLTSIIVGDDGQMASADLFQTTFERFGVPISNRWDLTAEPEGRIARMDAVAAEIQAATNSGTLYLAMNSSDAASFIKVLRNKGVQNKIVGPSQISTRAFVRGFETADYARYANGITTSAPLLFDTADESAQRFRSQFLATYQVEPDWIAALAHESVDLVYQGLQAAHTPTTDKSRLARIARAGVRDFLSGSGSQNAPGGLSGGLRFDTSGVADKAIQIGVYDGANLISSLTQLQPIGRDEVGNYIQAVREGRALYVNDRFMYKTNVVYSGLVVKDIRKFDKATGTFEMDFVIWFRFRGDFEPQDVIFSNAVEPIKLETPDRVEQAGELNYISYSVVGQFNTNFQRFGHEYGTDLLGTNFRHRILDRNNLLYVVDVIGMGLVSDTTMLDKLREANALSPSQGMIADRAWISQDVVRSNGFGSLTFVGNGKPQPDFSQITFGIVALNGAPSLRDFIPNEYLIYILIFAVIAAVFAMLMDRKKEGKRFFWNAQSWLLRVVSWPLLLLSFGSLALNLAFQQLEFYYVDMMVLVYRSLFWLVGASLISMAIERFLWKPLEQRADRKIPGSVRAMTSMLVYTFACFGIVGFVFNMGLTSLLASSGVAAMVVGLAIQGNLSNIFSGIVLNIERPFQVGDILRLKDDTEAEVMDITWRSIRVRSELGRVYSIPNTIATQSEMIRVTRARGETYWIQETVQVAPSYDPTHVLQLIHKALDSVTSISPEETPEVRFAGTRGEYAAYHVIFAVPDYNESDVILTEVWQAIWKELHNAGIEIASKYKPSQAPGTPPGGFVPVNA
jgi:potassium-dependent mechanosensitive channel